MISDIDVMYSRGQQIIKIFPFRARAIAPFFLWPARHSLSNLRREHLAIHTPVHLPADREVDVLAIGRPSRLGRSTLRVRQQPDVGSIRIHNENLVIGIAIRGECDLPSIR